MHLYETHIPVTDIKASEAFYRDIVGLPFAYREPARDIVFLWVDEKQKGMIGLWGPTTGYGLQNGMRTRCHLAFAVPFDQLQRAIMKLNQHGIETTNFGGKTTSEHQASSGGCHRRKSIFVIRTDIRSNSLQFLQKLEVPPSSDRIPIGKNF